jgi:apolipoprotein D and lipocalin family protein
MKIKIICFLIINLFMKTISNAQEVATVPHVDLNKYLGRWFEIASYPIFFQKRCHCTTATYTLSEKGYIIVENRCNRDSANGKLSYIKGKAFIVDNSGNAKLKVQFFWPFKGDYWIIDLADDYSYAVVSDPTKKYLWILCRTPKMDTDTFNKIIHSLKTKGFDTDKLKMTEQLV